MSEAQELNASSNEAAARRELFAVLAHELRSPIGAILGFEELISEGILGDVPPRSADALARIRSSARQLLDLVAGLSDLALETDDAAEHTHEQVDSGALVRAAVAALQHEAAGRETHIEDCVHDALPLLLTDVERASRALQLAFMAAIKASAGSRVQVHAHHDDGAVVVEVRGSRLDPVRDDPDVSLQSQDRARLTGAGLRLAMARTALAFIGGELTLKPQGDTVTLTIRLPQSQPD